MPGYISTAYDFIEDLRRNLRDRYKDCHAVLKELLQNADDAGASRVEITWVDRISGLAHPLLQGPLLFVFNNGPFSPRDALAVHRQGIGTKGHEVGKIGKFGLGLKSVFHLCEALIYISDEAGDSMDRPAEMPDDIQRTGLLNPWCDKIQPRHPEWEVFTCGCSDERSLRHFVEKQFRLDAEHWLCLCIPLRKKAHCVMSDSEEPGDWAIEPEYYGEGHAPPERLFCAQRIGEICQVLPLLTSIDRVTFSRSDPSGDSVSPLVTVASVTRDPASRSHWRMPEMDVGRRPVIGSLEVSHADAEVDAKSIYAGTEELLSLGRLDALRAREDWPRANAQTDRGINRAKSVAKQHAAVIIMETLAGHEGAPLAWQQAVFLPLGTPNEMDLASTGDHRFHVLLHGYFFVDAGRLDVDMARDRGDTTVRQEWNRLLYEQGVLPLLIPALGEYTKRLVGSPVEIREKIGVLTHLLGQSGLWQSGRLHICAAQTWAYRLRAGQSGWQAIPAALAFRELPGGSGTRPQLPFEVFPALGELGERAAVTFRDLPSLAGKQSELWPADEVVALLDSVSVETVTADEERFGYLVRTIQQVAGVAGTRVQEAMVRMVRRLLRCVPLPVIRKHHGAMAAILAALPSTYILPIEHDRNLVGESDRIFLEIAKLDLAVVPVPSFLLPETISTAVVSTGDARKILEFLAGDSSFGSQAEEYNRLRVRAVMRILAAWEGRFGGAVGQFGNLPLFPVHTSQTGRENRTLRSLADDIEAGLLFARSAGMLPALRSALADDQAVWIPYSQREIVESLEQMVGPIPACDATGCANCLIKAPALRQDTAPRLDLFERLVEAWDGQANPRITQVLRYLLHASQSALGDPATSQMFVTDDGRPWSVLAACILRARKQAWRMVDHRFYERMPSRKADALCLVMCQPETVARLFADDSSPEVDCSVLCTQDEWRRRIIHQWPDGEGEEDRLKKLPLFRRPEGGFTAIDDRTFIQSGNRLPPPEVFPEGVKLIADEEGAAGDRVHRLAEPMDAEHLLMAALKQSECSRHWAWILETIPIGLSDELRRALRTVTWLPAMDGTAVPPSGVIDRDSVEDHVRKLRSAGAGIVPSSDLALDLRSHPCWPHAVALFPSGEALYRVLAQALAEATDYAMGVAALFENNLISVAEHFAAEHDGREVMPAADLVLKLHAAGGPEGGSTWLDRHIAPAVRRPLQSAQATRALRYLAQRHRDIAGQKRSQTLSLFNCYLREATSQPEFQLSEVQLLSREGCWKDPRALAIGGHNVSPASLVHESHHEALRSPASPAKVAPVGEIRSLAVMEGVTPSPQDLREGRQELGEYLKGWIGDEVSGESVAVVAALLGDNDGFPGLYDQLREVRDLAQMRNEFSWQAMGMGWDLPVMMRNHHFWVKTADPKTATATNLLGQRFEAEVTSQLTAIFDGFDGRTYFPMVGEARCHVLRLRRIPPESLAPEEKLRILGNTVAALRGTIYWQIDDSDSGTWARICETSQLDIEVAQEMILDSSVLLIQNQLSACKSSSLRHIFSRWNQLRKSVAAAKQSKDTSALEKADEDRHRILTELRLLLTDDSATQQILLDESRRRLLDASYKAESVPFEIFQNADDAVVELATFFADGHVPIHVRLPHLLTRFVFEYSEGPEGSVIRFLHWGRAINQYKLAGIDRSSADFQLDMERMLVMHGSAKDDDSLASHRTGKFGLGFKSVFFLTDTPRVLSGSRSRFQAVAAIYPDHLRKTDEVRLATRLAEEGDPRHQGTIVELPLNPGTCPEEVFTRFGTLAGILAVFGRRIKQLSIAGPFSGEAMSTSWNPRQLTDGLHEIELGGIHGPDGREMNVIVFRCSEDRYDAVLFELGADGFGSERLVGTPNIWVTSPTIYQIGSPILINGAFELNPGRTQLRVGDFNRRRSAEIGRRFGHLLCQLFDEFRRDWPAAQASFGFGAITFEDFWKSLWDVCMRHAQKIADIASADGVLHEVLFGSPLQGLFLLAQTRPAFPTQMPGRYGCLTMLPDVKWITAGLLDDPDIWGDALVADGWLSTSVRPGQAISWQAHGAARCLLGPDVMPLTLSRILSEDMDDTHCVEPGEAEKLGRIINTDRLKIAKVLPGSDRNEKNDLMELLETVKFRTTDGEWHTAAVLLIRHAPDARQDESMRAAFAPDDHVLSDAYCGKAIDFFLACRGDMDAPSKSLAEWGLTADTEPKRRAFLDYLEKGDTSSQVRAALQSMDYDRLTSSWIHDDAQFAAATTGMTMSEKMGAAVATGQAVRFINLLTEAEDVCEPPSDGVVDPRHALTQILAWWKSDRDRILSAYDEMVYPGATPPLLAFSASQDDLEQSTEARHGWLGLLMLGVMGRMGRTNPQQHREFIGRCQREGWLEKMAAPMDDSTPGRWFSVLNEFLEDPPRYGSYFHWMNNLAAYYQVACWLPQYSRAFEAVTRPDVRLGDLQTIADIADLRTSHVFAGSTGFDAPPCTRVMGIGSFFVLRETVRARYRQAKDGSYRVAPKLAEQCFVPSLATRRLFARLGLSLGDGSPSDRSEMSKEMFLLAKKHLGEQDACFDGAFDIPFQMLNTNAFGRKHQEIFPSDIDRAPSMGIDPLDAILGESIEPETQV